MKSLLLFTTSAVLCSSSLFAQTVEKHTEPVNEANKSEFKLLMERVAALEKRVATLEKEKGKAPQSVATTDSSEQESLFTLGLAGYEQGDPFDKFDGTRLIVDAIKGQNFVRGIHTYHECTGLDKAPKWGKFDGTFTPSQEIQLLIAFIPDSLSDAGLYIADDDGNKIELKLRGHDVNFAGSYMELEKSGIQKKAYNKIKIKIAKGSVRLIVNDKFIAASPLKNKDVKFSKFGMYNMTKEDLLVLAEVVSLKK